MAKIVIWGATERQYRVECYDPQTGEEIEVYTAGNSYGDSQAYLDAEDGAGLEQMRAWAEQTAQEMAEDHDCIYGGEDEDMTTGIREFFEALDQGRL
jgi:hypothetical protein